MIGSSSGATLCSPTARSPWRNTTRYVSLLSRRTRNFPALVNTAKVNLDPRRREGDLLRQGPRRDTAQGLPRPFRQYVHSCHKPNHPKNSFPTPERTRDHEPQVVVKPRNARVGNLVLATDESLQIAVRDQSLEVADSPLGGWGRAAGGPGERPRRPRGYNIDTRPSEIAQKANIPTSDDGPSAPWADSPT